MILLWDFVLNFFLTHVQESGKDFIGYYYTLKGRDINQINPWSQENLLWLEMMLSLAYLLKRPALLTDHLSTDWENRTLDKKCQEIGHLLQMIMTWACLLKSCIIKFSWMTSFRQVGTSLPKRLVTFLICIHFLSAADTMLKCFMTRWRGGERLGAGRGWTHLDLTEPYLSLKLHYSRNKGVHV